ncbi:hypothetical protein [Alkalicoccobacillus murimartini]|uniref:Peptidase M50 domain-containing protein n=1 Tax=Alkalicoccobacillus murimartini TaxID=171685 RepID=A0ABT9YMF8_9BACI|nr:hypothetical protein [Alkalicoccobacillus murimartini]MDQ0209062.1 hypothetical protein [Alkalicoccobacillus murimartini]
MDILIWVSYGYLLLLIHISFHELGHYTVGRLFVHIPKENLKIRIFHNPPHVALRDQDNQWLIPGDKEGHYVRAYFTYDPEGKKSFLFVMGGFLLQTIVLLCLAFFMYAVIGSTVLANFVIGGSFVFNLIYIFADLIIYMWKRIPVGDTSAAFQFAPIKTVLFILGLLLSYVGMYLYIGFA